MMVVTVVPIVGCCVVGAGDVETTRNFVPDDLDALAGEEADLESALPAPPHGLVRRGHVDHGDHVANLEREREKVSRESCISSLVATKNLKFQVLVSTIIN